MNLVLLALFVFRHNGTRHKHFVIQDKQQRRQYHRQRHHQADAVVHRLWQNMVLFRDGQQHETEFARLCQAQAEQLCSQRRQAEQFAQTPQNHAFHQQQTQRHADDGEKLVLQQGEIHACAHRDKKQPQKQTFERFQMAFHFVAVIAVGQCDAGNERAQGRRQSH